VIDGQGHGSAVTVPVQAQDPLEALTGDLVASEDLYRTLFETMPMGIVHYDADGSVIGANKAAGEILGLDLARAKTWPVVAQGRTVREDGSPLPRGDLPVPRALRTGRAVADEIIGVTHAQTGELRWVQITAVPDARDEHGHPSRAYAIFTDLTEQRQTETALRQSTALLGRLREANVLGVVVAGERHVYEANDAYLDMIGYRRDDLEAGRIAWREISPPEWAGAQDRAVDQLRRSGACQPFEMEYVHQDGHRVPVLIGGAVLSRDPLRWTSFVVDLSARQQAERDRAALLERVQADRAEAESVRERLSFLMRAGSLVAATRNRDELLEQVTQLVVPSLADFCVAFLPTADGMLLASSISHRVETQERLLYRLREQPVGTAGPLILQRAYTTGSTQLAVDVAAEIAGWLSAEPEVTGIVQLVHPRSAVATPLLGPNGPLGVIVLGRGAGRAQFAQPDVQVIEELGRRLAAGLANADTFAREHDIAETLQRSLLPDTVPDIPGLDLAVRYLPATEGADVGGHNIASASIMGQVRSLLRAYAIDDPDPARVLERANSAVTSLLPDVLASVAYAVFNPADGDLCYANAGHPPPLIATGTGPAEYLDDTDGAMLGASAVTRFTAGRRLVRPGSRLLFYTDGLIEDRHRDITDGLAILAETLPGTGLGSAGQTCDTVLAALLGTGRRHDDVCLLTARIAGQDEPARLLLGPA
jgi:PAS domain S-box-containing protein